MNKMKNFKICIASGLAVVALLGGVFVGARNTIAENAPELQTASSLWENVEGITLEDNVDVPNYMKYGKYATDYRAPENLIEVSTDEEQNLAAWELNGLMMTSDADNKSISFKNTLDISNLTANDEFLTFSPIPSTRGLYDYTEVEFLFQDADDESNYLKITAKHWNPYWAATNFYIETPTASVGTTAWYSAFKGYTRDASGLDGNTDIRHRAVKIRYDTKTKTTYIVRHAGQIDKLRALDNEEKVGYGNAWKGFKNNRVNLSVTMRGFVAQKAQLMILNICGQGMNGTSLVDKAAPVFSFGEEANVLPTAQVGKNYPLYNVRSLDVVSGSIEPDCTVVSPSGQNVEIVDGGFIPTKGGYYTITYTSKDATGNTASKTFKVLATGALSPITIEAEQATGDFYTGSHIPVYEASAYGGSGKLNVTTEVVRVGGGENVTVEEGEFTPLLGGTYCVVYTAKDYLGNTATKTLSYEVKPTQKVEEWTVESITPLKRVFDGVQVCFPQPIAYDYTSYVGNRLNAKYEIAVYDKQNAREVLADGIFTPDKEKYGDSVKVEYVIYTNKDTTKAEAYKYTYDVPLYSREADGIATGQLEDYFAYDKEVFTALYNPNNDSEYMKFYTEQTGTAHSIEFVNPLIANGFSVNFALPAGEQNYESLTVSLRDSVDSRSGIDLELKKLDTSKTFVYSGGMRYAMNGAGNTFDAATGEEKGSATPLCLKFKDGQILDYTNAVVLTPTVGFDGKKFDGFASGKVYVKFTLNGVTDKASLLFTQICTHTLYAEYDDEGKLIPFTDIIAPTLVLSSDIKDAYYLNHKVVVPTATGYDVLTPYIVVYVTVRTPDGTKIYNKVPATEELSFDLTAQQGRYTIIYEAEDAENGTRKQYTIRAKDVTAPTVAISVTELQGKAGAKISLPTALILDDLDRNPLLYIMIVTPRAKIISLGERTEENAIDSYTFTEVGTYYIRYYAVDASYNVTITDIPVVISK